jgi:uncharacterized protein YcfL
MKKFLLVALIALGLVACSKKEEAPVEASAVVEASAPAVEASAVAVEASAVASDVAAVASDASAAK